MHLTPGWRNNCSVHVVKLGKDALFSPFSSVCFWFVCFVTDVFSGEYKHGPSLKTLWRERGGIDIYVQYHLFILELGIELKPGMTCSLFHEQVKKL